MGVNISWYVKPRIVLTYAWGNFTVDELKYGAESAAELIRAGQPMVHNIIDMRELTHYPTNVHEITKLTYVFREENLGWVILIASNPIVRFLTSMATQVARSRLRTVGEVEPALAFIQQVSPELDLPSYVLPDKITNVDIPAPK